MRLRAGPVRQAAGTFGSQFGRRGGMHGRLLRSVAPGVAVGATLGGLAAAWGEARAAACSVDPLNTVVRLEPNGRGLKVSAPGMGVFDGDVDCSRVSSLWVENSTGSRHVEIGWYEDPVDYYLCLPTTGTSPRIIALSYEGPNDYDCWGNPRTLSVGTDAFGVHDRDQDGVWRFVHEGALVWTSPDMGSFVTGLLYDNGERGNLENTAHADFDGLKRMGSGGRWVAPDSAYEVGYSDDPGSKPCIYSATHTAVKLNDTPC